MHAYYQADDYDDDDNDIVDKDELQISRIPPASLDAASRHFSGGRLA